MRSACRTLNARARPMKAFDGEQSVSVTVSHKIRGSRSQHKMTNSRQSGISAEVSRTPSTTVRPTRGLGRAGSNDSFGLKKKNSHYDSVLTLRHTQATAFTAPCVEGVSIAPRLVCRIAYLVVSQASVTRHAKQVVAIVTWCWCRHIGDRCWCGSRLCDSQRWRSGTRHRCGSGLWRERWRRNRCGCSRWLWGRRRRRGRRQRLSFGCGGGRWRWRHLFDRKVGTIFEGLWVRVW